jgi:RHS repeat-associated protein
MALGSTVGVTYDTYDDAGRLRQMTDNAGGVYGFNYDVLNRPTSRTLPNGIATTASYDGISRLTELKHALGSATINDFQYGYNSANDITQITEPARTRTFANDELHRLTSVTNSAGSNENYAYDVVGNRTSSHLSTSYGLQAFNKIVTTQSAQYTYDANGNMTSRFDAAGRWYFNWDSENRLVRVVKPGWRPVAYRTISYSYDALGRRVERRSKTGGTESYTYDGQDVILDQNSSGAQTTYINGPGIDNKLKVTTAAGSSYFLQDHLGSTTAMTDANGAVTSSATYDGYGRQTGVLPTRYGFTGREMDPDTDLMFYRARWYDPTLGRFISEDPIGFGGGDVNLYGYAWDNPVGVTDPMGLSGLSAPSSWADSLDADIDLAEEWYRTPPVPAWQGLVILIANAARGEVDLLRVGNGIDYAMSGQGTRGDRALAVGHDALRVLGIVLVVYGPVSGVVRGAFAGGAEACAVQSGASSAVQGRNLARQLTSEEQVSGAVQGQGEAIIGPGTGKDLLAGPRLAKEYGGNPGDWAKMRSASSAEHGVTMPNGGNFEAHWYQNTRTGQVVEIKTKIAGH